MYIIRECRIDDYIDIYELNKNEMGYDYPLEQQREKILQRQGDSLGCEQLEPYLSEMNVMKLTYQLPNGVTQDVAPLISAELKDLEKVEEDAGISESDGAER